MNAFGSREAGEVWKRHREGVLVWMEKYNVLAWMVVTRVFFFFFFLIIVDLQLISGIKNIDLKFYM